MLLAGSMLSLGVVLNASIVAGQLMRSGHGFEPVWGLAIMFGAFALLSLGLLVAFLWALRP